MHKYIKLLSSSSFAEIAALCHKFLNYFISNCGSVFDCFYFRAKLGGNQTESPIIASLSQGIALEFERSDAAKKLRLMLSELLFIMQQVFCAFLAGCIYSITNITY